MIGDKSTENAVSGAAAAGVNPDRKDRKIVGDPEREGRIILSMGPAQKDAGSLVLVRR